jgi:sigma-B regulation protein RsbU (phosphoserine phosphatase)
VMAMVKSAIRMAIARGAPCATVLQESNDILLPSMTPTMFVTVALVEVDTAGVQVALAGHLPVLHFKPAYNTVDDVYVANFPLGFFAGLQYATTRVTCAPGDVLVVITDGLTEVFDRTDSEFGLDGVKQLLVRNGNQHADHILASIIAAARRHGPQQDDQTALVIRFIR